MLCVCVTCSSAVHASQSLAVVDTEHSAICVLQCGLVIMPYRLYAMYE